jgi:hypothetical protein
VQIRGPQFVVVATVTVEHPAERQLLGDLAEAHVRVVVDDDQRQVVEPRQIVEPRSAGVQSPPRFLVQLGVAVSTKRCWSRPCARNAYAAGHRQIVAERPGRDFDARDLRAIGMGTRILPGHESRKLVGGDEAAGASTVYASGPWPFEAGTGRARPSRSRRRLEAPRRAPG